jgi:anti-sigma B factor antagonist
MERHSSQPYGLVWGIEVIVSGMPTSSDDGSLEPTPFTVRTVPWTGAGAGQAVVSVVGDVDMHSEGRLRDELVRLSEASARQLVLDFSGVEFMASAGVHVLLEMSARLQAAGGSLALACAHPMVARVMSLTGADELVPVLPTVADALAR